MSAPEYNMRFRANEKYTSSADQAVNLQTGTDGGVLPPGQQSKKVP